MNEKTYFEIMNELDVALPSTVELDYTKLSSDELWERISDFLGSVGIRKEDFKSNYDWLELSVRNLSLYNKKRHAFGMNNEGFDQNNYSIKNAIAGIKIYIMNLIKERFYACSNYYTDSFGSVDEIKSSIAPEMIEKYISDLLTITKENNDLFGVHSGYIADEILMRYGLSGERDDYVFISSLIDKAISNSSNMNGVIVVDIDQIRVDHDSQKFNEDVSSVIKEIKGFIVEKSNALLNGRLEYDRRRIEYENSKKVDKPVETTSTLTSSTTSSSSSGDLNSDLEPKIDQLIENFNLMKKLIAANEEKIAQISQIDAQIRELEEKINSLKNEKNRLVNELNENNDSLNISGMSHGIK